MELTIVSIILFAICAKILFTVMNKPIKIDWMKGAEDNDVQYAIITRQFDNEMYKAYGKPIV